MFTLVTARTEVLIEFNLLLGGLVNCVRLTHSSHFQVTTPGTRAGYTKHCSDILNTAVIHLTLQ